jgi:hypothetical protein
VADDSPQPGSRRRVRRGEGEVTQWPRGLAEYVPSGPDDATPSLEEDRTANRLALAARLLALLRSQGRHVDRELAALRTAEAEFARGDRAEAARHVDRLFADLDERPPTGDPPADTR